MIRHVRRDPKAKALYISVMRGKGSAERLYRSVGFEFTGKIHDAEHVMKLDLRSPRSWELIQTNKQRALTQRIPHA